MVLSRDAEPSAREHTNAVTVIGRAALVVARPATPAADRSGDPLFAARSALQRALRMRETADVQVEALRQIVDRLEAERRARI